MSKGGGRALGTIISKIHNNKDFGFNAYEKLYYSCVVPILDYASSVWGYRKFQTIDNIQNRTIRYFLGVHRFAPTLALHGDVGWIPSQFRRWTNMVRYWNRLVKFEDDRITKIAFNADYNRCTDNWCSELKDIFCKLNLEHYFDSKTAVNLKTVEMNIQQLYSNIWNDNIQQVPKLRTYVTFKSAFNQELYIKLNLTKVERSHLA